MAASVVSGVFSLPIQVPGASSIPPPDSLALAENPLPRAATTNLTKPPQRFIAGPENALLLAVARAYSATGSGVAWSPVVVWGVTGTGKSLLLQTLTAEFLQAHPQLLPNQTLITSGADFARMYANAVDADGLEDFRAKVDRLQLLVVDDLHRLATKPAAQKELVRLLDILANQSAVVLASLRQGPNETRGLTPMLASRLMQGLVVPLVPPASDTRLELVKWLAAQQGLSLADDVLHTLASPTDSRTTPLTTVPQLRQAMLQLVQRAAVENLPASLSLLVQLLKEQTPEKKLTMRQILVVVGKHFQLSLPDLKGQSRQQNLVHARGLAMYLCRQLTGASYALIGDFFSSRDHSTVMHAIRKTTQLLQSDAWLKQLCEEISAQLAVGDTRV